jgi:hypothetical protein
MSAPSELSSTPFAGHHIYTDSWWNGASWDSQMASFRKWNNAHELVCA